MGRLPLKVIAATTLVAVVPIGAVWTLRAAGVVDSFLECAALGAALSLLACYLASWIWQRTDHAGDVLFGDLMVWGWIRRSIQQRRLADAMSLLGVHRIDGASDPMALTVARRAELLEQLASNLEARDPYTHGHSRRVARYSALIGKRMGVDGEELARIRAAAAVHDVGKIDTPNAILHKPGRLTDSEFATVREHPAAGAEMVSILEDPELESIVRHHHERLDGTGYPDRLSGGQIPLGARIIAVADTFDAITSERPYRAARPHRQALEVLRSEAGTQLDRDAVTAFCSVYSGRRSLSVWVALTNVGERLVAWLAPDALSSTARVVALAATTAAVGGGVAALPASAHRPAGTRSVGITAHRTTSSGTAGAPAPRNALGAVAGGRGGLVSTSQSVLARTGRVSERIGPGGTVLTPTTGVGGTTVGVGTGGTGGTASTEAPVGSSTGGTATAPSSVLEAGVQPSSGGTQSGIHVTAGSSSGATTIGVSAGNGSGGGITAGVTVGGNSGSGSGSQSASGPSAGVSVGGITVGTGSGSGGSNGSSSGSGGSGATGASGVGAQVNVPGVISIKLHVGH